MKRKWRYLFTYASAGFAKGWITCHMITFIRWVIPKDEDVEDVLRQVEDVLSLFKVQDCHPDGYSVIKEGDGH